MKNNCLRCDGELVTMETENEAIKTRYCKECGEIYNAWTKEALEKWNEKVVRASDDGEIKEG